MNIAIGKIGKSVLFSPNKWGMVGGDSAPSILYTMLAELNPNINFYLIGKSDYSTLSEEKKLSLFPNKNVYDVWKDIKRASVENDYKLPINWLLENNINIDAMIIMSGMAGTVNIPGIIQKVKERNEIAAVLDQFSKYSGPIIHTMNMLEVPKLLLSEDPRHMIINARDLYKRETLCLSQCNTTKYYNHIIDYQNQDTIRTDVEVKYGHIEKIFLCGETKEIKKHKKDNLLTIFLNAYEGPSYNKKKPFIDEYIHSLFPDTKIYGKWPEELHKSDNRFQMLRLSENLDIAYSTKYTVIHSLKKGFITRKPWEMIQFGIVPFLHPDYDVDKLLNFPDICYLKSPVDLKQKIEYLESNEDEYKKLLASLNNLLKPEYYDGTFLNNLIMSTIYNLSGKSYTSTNKKYTIKMSTFNSNKQVINEWF